MNPNTVEEPTAKKKVAGGAGVAGVLLLAAVVMAITFKRPERVEVSTATPEKSLTGSAPASQFEAEALQRLQREVEGGPTRTSGDHELDPNPNLQVSELLAELDRATPPAGAASPVAAQLAASSAPNPLEQQAVQARLSPLKGVLEPAARMSESAAAGSEMALAPGTVIEAALAQSINSDYPGAPWLGIVTRDVMARNGQVAIAAGSKLIGTAQAAGGPNQVIQARVRITCERIVRNDGSVIELDAPVLDAAGVGAIAGKTNHHVLAQALGVAAYALVGSAAYSASSDEPYSAQSALQAQFAQGAVQQAAPLANKYLSVEPTVIPQPGSRLRIVLVKALAVPARNEDA